MCFNSCYLYHRVNFNGVFEMSLPLSPAKNSTLVSVRGRFDSPLVDRPIVPRVFKSAIIIIRKLVYMGMGGLGWNSIYQECH